MDQFHRAGEPRGRPPGHRGGAVIGIPHPSGRSARCSSGAEAGDGTRDELLTFLAAKVASWWLPDDVIFVRKSRTRHGKINKIPLREQYRNHLA